jgi:ubiquinone/menaquinone biosynthesis C-methylase UbiE
MNDAEKQIAFQRNYYGGVAPKFNEMNIKQGDEHYFALAVLEGLLNFFECRSLLDIGAGTGRTVRYFKEKRPDMKVMGVEPVASMREQAYQLGVSRDQIIEGDARKLPFEDGAFDVVTETGILHHIPNPEVAISEMLRVGKKAVFISDCNNLGQGAPLARAAKQILKTVGLWKAAYYLRSGGKGYWTSDGDGLAYPFSVYDHYPLIRSRCKSIHVINTLDAGMNPYRSAPHVALLGIKRD